MTRFSIKVSDSDNIEAEGEASICDLLNIYKMLCKLFDEYVTGYTDRQLVAFEMLACCNDFVDRINKHSDEEEE